MTHKLENSQPIINIEIANNTLYVLLYFISKCLDYSAVITTLHYITVNGVYVFDVFDIFVSISVSTFMEFLLPNQMLIAVIH